MFAVSVALTRMTQMPMPLHLCEVLSALNDESTVEQVVTSAGTSVDGKNGITRESTQTECPNTSQRTQTSENLGIKRWSRKLNNSFTERCALHGLTAAIFLDGCHPCSRDCLA